MRKNIIASLFATVNVKLEKTALAVDQAVSYAQHKLAAQNQLAAQDMFDTVLKLINAPKLELGDYQWQFEPEATDTSGKCDSYLALAAANTAFFRCVMTYRREFINVQDDKRAVFDTTLLLGSRADQAWGTPYDGFGATDMEDVVDDATFEETLYDAAVAYFYALHISRFDGNSWMLGFEHRNEANELVISKPLTTLTDYIISRADTDERFVILKDEAHLKHFQFPEVDVEMAKNHFQAWLHEYTPLPQGSASAYPYDTRHERILARVADNQFGKLVFNIQQGLTRKIENSPWELILCSPEMHWSVERFKATPEWQMYETKQQIAEYNSTVVKVKEMQELQALKDQLAQQTEQLKALLATPAEQAAQAAQTAQAAQGQETSVSVEVKTTLLPPAAKHLSGIAGTHSAFSLNTRGPRG